MPDTEPALPPSLLVVTGLGGLLASLALTIDRFRLLADPQTRLACDVSPFVSCGTVMESRAGALLGFPNPILGIVGFAVVVTTGVALLAGARLAAWYHRGLLGGVLAAAVFITWLQTQSLYVVGALCLWCLGVWLVTVPLVVVVTGTTLAGGALGPRLVEVGRVLVRYRVTVVAVWYLAILTAIGIRFYRDFALLWFGIAL